MDPLCRPYALTAYGLSDLAVGPSGFWPAVTGHWPSVVAGVAGGMLMGLAIYMRTRRQDRTLTAVTCGSPRHLHMPRRSAGGRIVWVCGPPRATTCGDALHPHFPIDTVAGDHVWACLTPYTQTTIRRAEMIHNLRKEIPREYPRIDGSTRD